jgi:hypothetical protein
MAKVAEAPIAGLPVASAPAVVVTEAGPIKGLAGRRVKDTREKKVSPTKPFTVTVELRGYEYGPFDVKAVDEAAAKAAILKDYPSVAPHLLDLIWRFN